MQQQLKHTPSPWVVESCSEHCGSKHCSYYWTSNGRFYQGTGYSKGDAILIAAAPDLYEALLDMISDRDCLSDATVENAKRAIAKAEGSAV